MENIFKNGGKTTELQRAKKEIKGVRNNRGGKDKVRGGEDTPRDFPAVHSPRRTWHGRYFPATCLSRLLKGTAALGKDPCWIKKKV